MISPMQGIDGTLDGYNAFGNDDDTPKTPDEVAASSYDQDADMVNANSEMIGDDDEEETFEITVETFNFLENKCTDFPLQVVKATTFADIRATLSSPDDLQANDLHIHPMRPETRFMLRSDPSDAANNNKNLNQLNNIDNQIFEWQIIDMNEEATLQCSEYRDCYFCLSFDINILDGLRLNASIPVTRYHTVDQILKYLKTELEVLDEVQILSYGGEKLGNYVSLDALQISTDMRATEPSDASNEDYVYEPKVLKSRIEVVFEDRECDMSVSLLVYEFWSLKQVVDKYLEESRREWHAGFGLEVRGDGGIIKLQDYVVSENRTLFSEGLGENGTRFEYFVGAYPVKIFDSEMGRNDDVKGKFVELKVYDHWKLSQVKEHYARQTRKPFLEFDRIVCNDRQLEDDVFLWKLRVRDNEELVIDRQELEVKCNYICSECGNLVQLRRIDPVGCRECDNNILFKARTQRICQYNCR